MTEKASRNEREGIERLRVLHERIEALNRVWLHSEDDPRVDDPLPYVALDDVRAVLAAFEAERPQVCPTCGSDGAYCHAATNQKCGRTWRKGGA